MKPLVTNTNNLNRFLSLTLKDWNQQIQENIITDSMKEQ